ncbi:hypothetical protein [Streptomyces sp. JV178]|uniref:hypothetical protein n=1 Tax=Streptomyces sp. JV178 TaxID=858632 RepID=UPI0015D54941|nr:hypothetical protein [Streptomyces sp. JV178]
MVVEADGDVTVGFGFGLVGRGVAWVAGDGTSTEVGAPRPIRRVRPVVLRCRGRGAGSGGALGGRVLLSGAVGVGATGFVGVGVLGPVTRVGAPVGWGVDLWMFDLVPSGPAVMSRGTAGVAAEGVAVELVAGVVGVAAGVLDEVLGVTVDR